MSKKLKALKSFIRTEVYRLKGAPYSDDINPFNPTRIEFEQFKRTYISLQQLYMRMESILEEMTEVYGD